MNEKIKKIEERIEKRKARILNYEESLKEEKRLLKKDEENLSHIKYDGLLKILMENNISSEDILNKVEEVIIEKTENESDEDSKALSTELSKGGYTQD